ncbi:MAG: thioredoxin family protein [Bacilli bacterium]|nr:thioredoxin family protein [Bacilli bacterium]
MKIIKITALWCPSCLIMNGMIDDIISKYNFEMISYDFDLDKDEVEKYNVGNILPVLIKVDDNLSEIARLTGEHKEKEVEEFLKE